MSIEDRSAKKPSPRAPADGGPDGPAPRGEEAPGDLSASAVAEPHLAADAPYGHCLHCGKPLPAPLRRGGRALKYCPKPAKCSQSHHNELRDRRTRATAGLRRVDEDLAIQAAPSMADLARLLTDHAARAQALLTDLGERQDLEDQITELETRAEEADTNAQERIRAANAKADAAIAQAQAEANAKVAEARLLATQAHNEAARQRELADGHQLARGIAEGERDAALLNAEQARALLEQAQRDHTVAAEAAATALHQAQRELTAAETKLTAALDHARRAERAAAEQTERADQASRDLTTERHHQEQTERDLHHRLASLQATSAEQIAALTTQAGRAEHDLATVRAQLTEALAARQHADGRTTALTLQLRQSTGQLETARATAAELLQRATTAETLLAVARQTPPATDP